MGVNGEGAQKVGRGRRQKEGVLQEQKIYEEMIERKKPEERQGVLKRIVVDKSGKTFWEEINKGRKRRKVVDKSITEDEWRMHLREQLGEVGRKESGRARYGRGRIGTGRGWRDLGE